MGSQAGEDVVWDGAAAAEVAGEWVVPHSHVVDKNQEDTWEPVITGPGHTIQPRVPAPGR